MIKQIKFSPSAKYQWITKFEGKFVFYLDVTDCETIGKLELCCLYHIFRVLKHEADLKFTGVEYYVIIFNIYFVWFTNNSTLTNMIILDIIKIYLIIFLCEKPLLVIICVIFLSFRSKAYMKRIKTTLQIPHFII